MIEKLSFDFIAEEVKKPKKTHILCHKNPDPDTLGSAFALKHILEHFGSYVSVFCTDECAKKFSFITGGTSLEYTGEVAKRVIAVDVASPTQLGELDFLASSVDFTIDHHQMSTRFSPYYESFTASCAEIIFSLADKLELLKKLPLHFFECVYAGISSDTGCFKFSNVTPQTMKNASLVIESGIDHAEINRIIFDAKSIGEIKAQRLTYENMELCYDGKLSLVMFTNEMKQKNGLIESDIGDIVSYVRSVDGVLVALSLKQSSKDETKFSLSSRANTDIDVSKVCASLGGGGHKRASGATVVASTPEEAIEIVKGLFIDAIKEYEEKLNG